MLTREDNDLLVRVELGQPMNALLRRFWVPAFLQSELPEPDGPPIRVKLLGEPLLAFRDSNGKVGLIDRYCPHRRASLFWGRNEDCGLRCVYHGWKFDITGQCVDLPNATNGDRIKSKVSITSYPTMEKGGIVWAYMGPPELKPVFPDLEIASLPADHRYIQKMIIPTNWFQSMEGDVDSSHVSFLHNRVDNAALLNGRLNDYLRSDTAPQWIIEDTDYGVSLAARRRAEDGNLNWRINRWLMPFITLVASPLNLPFIANIRMPVDDENTIHYRIYARRDQPLTEEDWAIIRSGDLFPEMIPGSFQTKANVSNDYLIDRDEQRNRTFTGIKSIPVQDYAVTCEQGDSPIADRSLERLVDSDRAIVAVRRRMLAAVKGLRDGVEPNEIRRPEAFKVAPIDTTEPEAKSYEEISSMAF